MKAAVVIGANYGDEGKGLVTDYLAANAHGSGITVIRYNAGAQAGHTVQLQSGLRHVFSHFSSGTFAGSKTYLSEYFVANPILFNQELAKLISYGYPTKPTIHPAAVVSTPYDMYLNQLFETSMGKKRHGSCGVGIGETIERNLHKDYQLTVSDLFNQSYLRKKLLLIRDQWVELRSLELIKRKLSKDEQELVDSSEVFDHFLSDIQLFLENIYIDDYDSIDKDESIIFEGAQGLRLDQNNKHFPHVTRSNTGIENVSWIAKKMHIDTLDIHYVTRCYLTRHGAGPLADEYSNCPFINFKDETNIPHKFQGSLRFAPLNIHTMNKEINADLDKLSHNISRQITLVTTCLDHFEESIAIMDNKNKVIKLGKNELKKYIIENCKFDHYVFSSGPTRNDCEHSNSLG